jgi:hypothetical protein
MDKYTIVSPLKVRSLMKDPVEDIIGYFHRTLDQQFNFRNTVSISIVPDVTSECIEHVMEAFKANGYTCTYVSVDNKNTLRVHIPTPEHVFQVNFRMAMIERCSVDVARFYY